MNLLNCIAHLYICDYHFIFASIYVPAYAFFKIVESMVLRILENIVSSICFSVACSDQSVCKNSGVCIGNKKCNCVKDTFGVNCNLTSKCFVAVLTFCFEFYFV